MKSITIQLTEQDMIKGVPGSATRCVLATAIHRVTNKHYRVGATYYYLNDNRVFNLPAKAKEFRSNYDRGRRVDLISFEIEVD